MTLAYGFVKAKIVSEPLLKPSRHSHEIQYHLHFNLLVEGAIGTLRSMSEPTTLTTC